MIQVIVGILLMSIFMIGCGHKIEYRDRIVYKTKIVYKECRQQQIENKPNMSEVPDYEFSKIIINDKQYYCLTYDDAKNLLIRYNMYKNYCENLDILLSGQKK